MSIISIACFKLGTNQIKIFSAIVETIHAKGMNVTANMSSATNASLVQRKYDSDNLSFGYWETPGILESLWYCVSNIPAYSHIENTV